MTEQQNDPDVALMLRVADGDKEAFEQLMLKYQKAVFNTAYRYVGNPSVAEELAQDVFVRVFRAAPGYRPEARFTTWLFTIVRNVCANYRARKGKHDQDMEAEFDGMLPAQGNPETEMIQKQLQARVQEAIQSLPENLRMPLVLHQFNQMQYEEIAQVLDLSLSAVKIRIYRARQALAEKLKRYL